MDIHVVPDSSVVIKWFRQGENLAEQALALRTGYLDGRIQLSVPTLLAYELTNVLPHVLVDTLPGAEASRHIKVPAREVLKRQGARWEVLLRACKKEE